MVFNIYQQANQLRVIQQYIAHTKQNITYILMSNKTFGLHFLLQLLFLYLVTGQSCYTSCTTLSGCSICTPIEIPFCTACSSNRVCSSFSTNAQTYMNRNMMLYQANNQSLTIAALSSGSSWYAGVYVGYYSNFQMISPLDSSYYATNQFSFQITSLTNGYLRFPHCSSLTSYTCDIEGLPGLDPTPSDYVFNVIAGVSGAANGVSFVNQYCSNEYLQIGSTYGTLFPGQSISTVALKQASTFQAIYTDSTYPQQCLVCSAHYQLQSNGTCSQCKNNYTVSSVVSSCDTSTLFCSYCLSQTSCCDYVATIATSYIDKQVNIFDSTGTLMLTVNTLQNDFYLPVISQSVTGNIFSLETPLQYWWYNSTSNTYYTTTNATTSNGYVSILFKSFNQYLTCEVGWYCWYEGSLYTPTMQIFQIVTSLEGGKSGVSFQSVLYPGYYIQWQLDSTDLKQKLTLQYLSSSSTLSDRQAATFQLKTSGCQNGYTNTTTGCQCLSGITSNGVTKQCSYFFPFCNGCSSDMKCCSSYVSNTLAINQLVYFQNFIGTDVIMMKVDNSSGLAVYDYFASDKWDASFIFKIVNPVTGSTTDKTLISITSELNGGYLTCAVGQHCYTTSTVNGTNQIFKIMDGAYYSNLGGTSLVLASNPSCYLVQNGTLYLDCTSSTSTTAKTWKVLFRGVVNVTFDSVAAASIYSPIFLFHSDETYFPVSIDTLNFPMAQSTFTDAHGATYTYVNYTQTAPTSFNESAPVYYSIRQDTYNVYIVYSLFFQAHDCLGDVFYFNMQWVIEGYEFITSICPFGTHDADIEYAILKFSKGGNLLNITLSGQKENAMLTYSMSSFSMNGYKPYIYVAQSTHSLYPQDGTWINRDYINEMFCVYYIIGTSCLGIQAYFREVAEYNSSLELDSYQLIPSFNTSILTSRENFTLNQFVGKIGGLKTVVQELEQMAEARAISELEDYMKEKIEGYFNDLIANMTAIVVPGLIDATEIPFLEDILDDLGLLDDLEEWIDSVLDMMVDDIYNTAFTDLTTSSLFQGVEQKFLSSAAFNTALNGITTEITAIGGSYVQTEGADSVNFRNGKAFWQIAGSTTNGQVKQSVATTVASSSLTTMFDLLANGYNCFANSDCQDYFKSQCLSNICSPCTGTSNCTQFGNNYTCSSGQCVLCTSDSGCPSPLQSQCTFGSCVSCNSDSQCSRFSSTPYCNSTTGSCIAFKCFNNSGCTTKAQPSCNTQTNLCGSCVLDSECSGFTGYGKCISGSCQAQCTNATQCTSGQSCSNGVCIDCTTNAQCISKGLQFCQYSKCLECNSTINCTSVSKSYCNISTSLCSACITDSQCSAFPSTPYCNTGGKCVACKNNSQCAAGYACNQTCVAIPNYCSSNSSCTAGQYCNNTQQCSAIPNYCTSNTSCSNGSFCSSNLCQVIPSYCVSNSSCSAGTYCSNSQCTAIPNYCSYTQACSAGSYCANSLCVGIYGYCASNNSCSAGYYCSNTSYCTMASNYCYSNYSCSAGAYCNNSLCQSIPNYCVANTSCSTSFYCKNSLCQTDPNYCKNASNCSAGYYCSNTNYCTMSSNYCYSNNSCSAGTYCNNSLCSPIPNYCATNTSCSSSFYCKNSLCQTDPNYCTNSSNCSAGFSCSNNQCTAIYGYCTSNTSCQTGLYCLNTSCTAIPNYCYSNLSCNAGNYCSSNYCKAIPNYCIQNSTCQTAGQYCAPSSLCSSIPNYCASNSSCLASQYCSNSQCTSIPNYCTTNQTCADGNYCSNSSLCSPNYCTSNSTCTLGQYCSSLQCYSIPNFCLNNQSCLTVGQYCNQYSLCAVIPTTGGGSISGFSSSCLSLDSRVLINLDGSTQLLRDIKVGDQVISYDESSGQFVQDSVKAMIHQSKNTISEAIKITILNRNQTLITSPSHLMMVVLIDKQIEYKLAGEVQIGDTLLNFQNGLMETSIIIAIENIQMVGYSAPLTGSGTLIVDQIVVSCYAETRSQSLANFGMWPLKNFKWIQDWQKEEEENVHPYANWLKYLAEFIPIGIVVGHIN